MREGVNGLLSYKTRKPRKSPLLSGCGKSSGQIGADLKVYAVYSSKHFISTQCHLFSNLEANNHQKIVLIYFLSIRPETYGI